jgi:hypothetical protein
MTPQTPVITVRCSNPSYDPITNIYVVNVDFQSDIPNQKLYGMNVRFFYDSTVLKFSTFDNFATGYGKYSPNPPYINTGNISSAAAFGFTGPATFVNGAIILKSKSTAPFIPTTGWVKLFKIKFLVQNLSLLPNFCPSVVWDLNKDNTNGLGVPPFVITVSTDALNENGFPMYSWYATERCQQFNWEYSSTTTPPFGHSVSKNCINA